MDYLLLLFLSQSLLAPMVAGGGVPCASVAWIDPPAHAIPDAALTNSPLTVRIGLSTRVYAIDPMDSVAMKHAYVCSFQPG